MSNTRKEQLVKWLSNIQRVLRGSFTSNLHIKLLSLALAFVIWPIMMLYTNPMRTRPVDDVFVSIRNLDVFNDSLGLTTVENINDLIRTVDVEISIAQEDRAQLSASAVNAFIDMRQVEGVGETVLPIYVQSTHGTPVSWEPSSITVTVDKLISKQVPIRINRVGPLDDGYREVEEPVAQPDRLMVYGAESVVNSIYAARVDVDYAQLLGDSDGYSVQYPVTFIGEDNEPVMGIDNITVPDLNSVIVSGRILPTAIVPVQYGAESFSGSPAEGYELKLVTNSANNEVYTELYEDSREVTIVAPRDVLDTIDSVTFEAININGRNESFDWMATLKKPSGVVEIDPETAGIYVSIEEIWDTRKYADVTFQERGTKPGVIVVYKDVPRMSVNISAPRSFFQMFQRTDITAYIDVSAYTVGKYTVDVLIEIVDSETGIVLQGFRPEPEYMTIDIEIVEEEEP